MSEHKRQFVSDDTRIIARNLKDIRQCCGVSQQEIGKILGVTFQQIQKYENGSNRLSIEKLFILKEFYGLPYEVFFKGMTRGENRPTDKKVVREYIGMLLERCEECERRRVLEVLCILVN